MPLIDKILGMVFKHDYSTEPGFILEHFGSVKLRNVFLSETALANIEKAVKTPKGQKVLYEAGKEFGYSYANAIPLPHSNFPFRDSAMRDLIRFFESTYGHCTHYKAEWEKNAIDLGFQDFAICRKNGNGILFWSAFAGLAAYLFNDKTIEWESVSCQGKGALECESIYAPKAGKVFSHDGFPEPKADARYDTLNTSIQFKPDYGLDMLSQVGIMKYSASAFDIRNERFLPVEITFMHHVEKKLQDAGFNLKKTVYEPVFSAFKDFGKKNLKQQYKEPLQAAEFASKLFSALGWGIIQVQPGEKLQLSVQGFPWTPDLEALGKSQYFAGAMDGLLTGLTGKNVKSEIIGSQAEPNNFTVRFSKK